MKVTKDYVFFFTFKDVFSNWYESPLWVKTKRSGITYKFSCMEQYMMWAKAYLFRDYEIAEQILTHEGIRKGEKPQAFYKRMGRSVANFDGQIWDNLKESIIKAGLRSKFSKGTDAHKELMSYPNKTFVEASPYDAIYGIKMDMWDDGVEDPSNWRGKNLLGQWITDIRDEFEEVSDGHN